MHVLLTNDDGPLDDRSCPYMKYFVDELKRSTDWKVLIVVPNQQRSWIGKAHFAGKALVTTYIYTKDLTAVPNSKINNFEGPFDGPQPDLVKDGFQQWCLVDSTPAACADIGLHHLKSHEQPVDLVISGPNFGKNAGNLYMLASGTVGAAMEAVTHGTKAVALSYEFHDLNHNFDILKEASKISVRLVAHLYGELQKLTEIDLFTVNVPLIPSLEFGKTKIKYAPILENSWGSIYKAVGEGKYVWAPQFDAVAEDGHASDIHSDSRVLIEEGISVTPLKAAFRCVEPFHGEIDLGDVALDTPKNTLLITMPEESYLYKPVTEAFQELGFSIETNADSLHSLIKKCRVFHYCDYEDVDLDLIQSEPKRYFVPTYIYRKALIRKHFLSNTVQHFVAKNPQSVLVRAFPASYHLQVDYAEFLDDSLDEAYELRGEIELGDKTWILKPSMSDKGQGIRIFRSVEQLQAIFDAFDEGVTTDDEEDDIEENNGVIVSQLRHFIVQEYQNNPLLLLAYSRRKFHLRVYVLAVGDLKVYVYENILTLFAGEPFIDPSIASNKSSNDVIDLSGHLTNTCIQDGTNPLVVPFWNLKDISSEKKSLIFEQVKDITADLFRAAHTVDKINFQAMCNSLEVFGVDFLVNDDYSVKLLEVNSYPDFKQTGDELKKIIYDLFKEVAANAVAEMFDLAPEESRLMHRVL